MKVFLVLLFLPFPSDTRACAFWSTFPVQVWTTYTARKNIGKNSRFNPASAAAMLGRHHEQSVLQSSGMSFSLRRQWKNVLLKTLLIQMLCPWLTGSSWGWEVISGLWNCMIVTYRIINIGCEIFRCGGAPFEGVSELAVFLYWSCTIFWNPCMCSKGYPLPCGVLQPPTRTNQWLTSFV